MSDVLTALRGLVDRSLEAVYISDDGESAARIVASGGHELILDTEGDCCSESWWADVVGAKSAQGGMILGAEELDLPELPADGQRTRQESDCQYGYSLHTSKGTVDLIFRNSSNGYYGGWAFVAEPFKRAVNWTQIDTDDWQA